MRTTLATLALVLVSGTAFAEDPDGELTTSSAQDDLGDQGIGADLGIAAGGRVTPGGLRIAGHYLYQLSSSDWFDGTASFTYGSDPARCRVDQMSSAMACDHGLADGGAVEIAANVRRVFAARGAFRPFARAGVGVSLVRFSRDDVSGIAVPLHLGGGLRTRISSELAIVTQVDAQVGLGRFDRGLGLEPQLGLAITAGAEFRLR